jgi:hypothetical protein
MVTTVRNHEVVVSLSPQMQRQLGISSQHVTELWVFDNGDWTVIVRAHPGSVCYGIYTDPLDDDLFDILDRLADLHQKIPEDEIN